MTIDIDWYREGRIVFSRLSGEITLDEPAAAGQKINEMISAGDAPVHLLVDLKAMAGFPTSTSALRMSMVYVTNPKLGFIAVYGGSSLSNIFARVVFRLVSARYRIFNTHGEALAFLLEQDGTLAAK